MPRALWLHAGTGLRSHMDALRTPGTLRGRARGATPDSVGAAPVGPHRTAPRAALKGPRRGCARRHAGPSRGTQGGSRGGGGDGGVDGARAGRGKGKEGERRGEGKLTLGFDDRRQPSTRSHLGQGRWKRGGREGEGSCCAGKENERERRGAWGVRRQGGTPGLGRARSRAGPKIHCSHNL
jgi:hypothetical protein